ncbi:RCC1 and BTB domain-containing protein 1-like [Planococcus citri]|uniref:RCC1 and BTB domain-containing protein 1-like n=1 Tax=Planococcus citri TaxID=170843 RepID=UPI0031F890E0
MDIRKYLCEWKLSDDFIKRIETFAIWIDEHENSNVLFVTKNREVYAAEKFSKFCVKNPSIVDSKAEAMTKTEFYEPVKLSPLCGKRIKKFVFGKQQIFICAEEGEVFVYGYYRYYDGNKKTYRYVPVVPQKVRALLDLPVVDIAIGPREKHLALCDDGRLYVFNFGELEPAGSLNSINTMKVKLSNVLYVTRNFGISLLENGKVMKIEIGDADFDTVPKNISQGSYCVMMDFENVANPGKIVKLIGGYSYALALDENGSLFVTDSNRNQQLGIHLNNPKSPTLCENFILNSFTTEKIVDIAVSCFCSLSAALTESGKVYMWGKGRGGIISEPQLTPFESLHEVFYHYSSPSLVTYKPINVNELPDSTSKSMKKLDPVDAQNSLLDSFKKAFDDPKFCDLFVVVEGKTIPVHKSILAVRCEHFAEVFQNDWSIEKPSVLEIEDGDFNVYKAFLKYVYTDQMDDTLSFDELMDLLSLANKYNVKLLAERCVSLVQRSITVENVVSLYERVIVMSNVTKMKDILNQLKESCVKFCANNFFAIAVSDEFAKLNERMSKELVVEVGKLRIKE